MILWASRGFSASPANLKAEVPKGTGKPLELRLVPRLGVSNSLSSNEAPPWHRR